MSQSDTAHWTVKYIRTSLKKSKQFGQNSNWNRFLFVCRSGRDLFLATTNAILVQTAHESIFVNWRSNTNNVNRTPFRLNARTHCTNCLLECSDIQINAFECIDWADATFDFGPKCHFSQFEDVIPSNSEREKKNKLNLSAYWWSNLKYVPGFGNNKKRHTNQWKP